MNRFRLATLPVAVAAATVMLAGCVSAPQVTVGASPSPSASAAPSPSASTAPSPTQAQCTNATVSFAPQTSSAYANEIKNRGYLLVGVSADTRLLGAVDPFDPNTFEGFDIDMARLVAEKIFGTVTAQNLRFKVITTAARIEQLSEPVNTSDNAAGGVDMVARAFTMNCSRWEQIAFSAEYFNAHQGLLVPANSTVKGVADLAGRRVCAPRGSTSLTRIVDEAPQAKVVGVDSHTDCLVALQEGTVDAITGDNTILAGFEAQDPGTVVLKDVRLSDEPYGLGVSSQHKDFAAYINEVLRTAIADGTWQQIYDRWLKVSLGPGTPPKQEYGRR